MASFWSQTVDIDYDIWTGEIRAFTFKDRVLYDRDESIAHPRWKQVLCAYIRREALNNAIWAAAEGERLGLPGPAYHAFVAKLINDGEIAAVA